MLPTRGIPDVDTNLAVVLEPVLFGHRVGGFVPPDNLRPMGRGGQARGGEVCMILIFSKLVN